MDPYSECISDSLDLFGLPYMDKSLENEFISIHGPTEPINDTTTEIYISIPPCTDWTDLSRKYLVECAIKRTNG